MAAPLGGERVNQVAVVGAQPAHTSAEEAAAGVVLIRRLAPHANLFTLEPPCADCDDDGWAMHRTLEQTAARGAGRPLAIGVAVESDTADLEW